MRGKRAQAELLVAAALLLLALAAGALIALRAAPTVTRTVVVVVTTTTTVTVKPAGGATTATRSAAPAATPTSTTTSAAPVTSATPPAAAASTATITRAKPPTTTATTTAAAAARPSPLEAVVAEAYNLTRSVRGGLDPFTAALKAHELAGGDCVEEAAYYIALRGSSVRGFYLVQPRLSRCPIVVSVPDGYAYWMGVITPLPNISEAVVTAVDAIAVVGWPTKPRVEPVDPVLVLKALPRYPVPSSGAPRGLVEEAYRVLLGNFTESLRGLGVDVVLGTPALQPRQWYVEYPGAAGPSLASCSWGPRVYQEYCRRVILVDVGYAASRLAWAVKRYMWRLYQLQRYPDSYLSLAVHGSPAGSALRIWFAPYVVIWDRVGLEYLHYTLRLVKGKYESAYEARVYAVFNRTYEPWYVVFVGTLASGGTGRFTLVFVPGKPLPGAVRLVLNRVPAVRFEKVDGRLIVDAIGVAYPVLCLDPLGEGDCSVVANPLAKAPGLWEAVYPINATAQTS